MKKSRRRVAGEILALLDSDYLPPLGDGMTAPLADNELAIRAVEGLLIQGAPTADELEKLAKAYLTKNRLTLDGEESWKALVGFAQSLQ